MTRAAVANGRPGRTASRGPKKIIVPSVDGFRGLAVLWIVVGHAWWELGGRTLSDPGVVRYLVTSAYFGVDMLFIVSGFVLFLPVARSRGQLGPVGQYFKRRLARVIPGFYAALVFAYIVARVLGATKGGAGAFFSHIFFVHHWAHGFTNSGFGVNGVMWTMTVEMCFYISLPLVARRYYEHPFRGLAIAVIAAAVWHALATEFDVVLGWFDLTWASTTEAQLRLSSAYPSYVAHFAAGMTAAWIYVAIANRRPTLRLRTLASYVVGLALTGVLLTAIVHGSAGHRGTAGPLDHWVKTWDRVAVFTVLILATALALSSAQVIATNPFSRLLGVVSYGIYLSHLPLIKVLIPVLGMEVGTSNTWAFVALVAVVTPLSILVGIVSFVILEEPFRRWARRPRAAGPGVAEAAPEQSSGAVRRAPAGSRSR